MALGGGSFTAQDKILPGAYINFATVSSATVNIFGSRGTVAIVASFTGTDTVLEWTFNDFKENCKSAFGVEWDAEYDAETENTKYAFALREIFKHATKVIIGKTTDDIMKKSFNILICDNAENQTTYHELTKKYRDELGVKFQTIYYDFTGEESEYAISLSGENDEKLIYWTAGALAGVSFAKSLCNVTYDGEMDLADLKADVSQEDLKLAIESGQLIFHRVGDEARILDDINTYTTDNTAEKTKDPAIFGDNQSIRIIDQIANDVAIIFRDNYLGKVPATESGRGMFWSELTKYLEQMQELGGITDFNSGNVIVEAGEARNSVLVTMVITLSATMKKLYMQVTVQ